MLLYILELLLALLVLYTLFAFLLSRVLGIGIFRFESKRNTVALTFDDGPNDRYTPALLDMLRGYGVKATFFVLGTQAEKHPDLIARMHREGHAIGLHGYHHHPHWMKAPRRLQREVEQAADMVERITGVRPALFRPPWGLLNLADYVTLRKYRMILWSVMVGDWRKQDPERLYQRLRRRVRAGSVIVLHDSDHTPGAEEGAPATMLQALDKLLRELTPLPYRFVLVDEMDTAKPSLVTRLWLAWERAFQRLFQVKALRSEHDFLLVRQISYAGKEPVVLDDGTELRHGDPLIELHLNNQHLLRIHEQAHSELQLAKLLLHEIKDMLPVIADYLDRPEQRGIKALYGISLINRGVRALGFTTLPMARGLFAAATQWYLRLLLRVLHPAGRKRVQTRTALLTPMQVAMSRQELLKRYSTPSR